MRKELELVCKSLGALCLCAGALFGIDILSRLWGPTLEFPALPLRPDAAGAAHEALKPFYEAFQPALSTRLHALIPQWIARSVCPIVMGLFLMRSRLLVDLAYGRESDGRIRDRSLARETPTKTHDVGSRDSTMARTPEISGESRFAPPGYAQ